MKKLLIILALLLPSLAQAQIIPTLPVTLTNGTLADANQVMSNFNAIVTGVNNNAATNGANSNITALNGLTTPLVPASGGSSVYTGADSGSSNAYAVTTTVPINYTLRAGNTVNFIPSFQNTGPATLTVAGTTATTILRQTAAGLQPLGGGEIVTSQIASVVYDGVQYELLNSAVSTSVAPCTVIDYGGITVPSGYLAGNGATASRATFATLFSCLNATNVAATINGTTTVTVANGTLYQAGWFVGGANITCNSVIQSVGATTIVLNNAAGATGSTTLSIGPNQQGDCSTTFTLPNYQGRATVMADTAGGTLASAACANPGSIGSKCGSTTQLITQANLPGVGFVNSGIAVSNGSLLINGTPSGGCDNSLGHCSGGAQLNYMYTSVSSTNDHPVVSNVTVGAQGAAASGGSGTPLLLQPIALVTKAIKF